MSSELPFDIPNWFTLLIELAFAGAITYWLYRLQRKTEKIRDELLNEIRTITKRTDSVTQKKARTEQENKVDQCKIIIEQLQGIQDAEQKLKAYLDGYKVGDPEVILNLQGMALDGLANSSIYNMNDAIGQLEGRLNDIDKTLRKDFVDYIGKFRLVPKRILRDKPHGYIPDGLLHDIDDQTKKIQEFIGRFSKEMDSS